MENADWSWVHALLGNSALSMVPTVLSLLLALVALVMMHQLVQYAARHFPGRWSRQARLAFWSYLGLSALYLGLLGTLLLSGYQGMGPWFSVLQHGLEIALSVTILWGLYAGLRLLKSIRGES